MEMTRIVHRLGDIQLKSLYLAYCTLRVGWSLYSVNTFAAKNIDLKKQQNKSEMVFASLSPLRRF